MNPAYKFSGQVAFVTGAAKGMGLAAAKGFARNGAKVMLADVDEAALRTAVSAIEADGGTAAYVLCDVSAEDQVAAAVAATVDRFGRLDMAYNNAGIQVPPTDAADETAENYNRVTGVNMGGVWASMKHELKQMRKQGSGAIVNCSSLGGLIGLPERAAYHAAKHGVIGMTRSAAIEYASRGVRINAICPGIIDTPMVQDMLQGQTEAMDAMMKTVPAGRLGQAEEVAEAVLWLCSPGASFVTGIAVPVDGGFTA